MTDEQWNKAIERTKQVRESDFMAGEINLTRVFELALAFTDDASVAGCMSDRGTKENLEIGLESILRQGAEQRAASRSRIRRTARRTTTDYLEGRKK